MSFDLCSPEGHFKTGNATMGLLVDVMEACGVDLETARDRDVGIATVNRVKVPLAYCFSSNDGWEVLPIESREMAAKMTGRAGEDLESPDFVELVERYTRFCEASPFGFFVV